MRENYYSIEVSELNDGTWSAAIYGTEISASAESPVIALHILATKLESIWRDFPRRS